MSFNTCPHTEAEIAYNSIDEAAQDEADRRAALLERSLNMISRLEDEFGARFNNLYSGLCIAHQFTKDDEDMLERDVRKEMQDRIADDFAVIRDNFTAIAEDQS